MVCSDAFQKLEHAIRDLSLFSIVGTTHVERWHSAFIAWILNPNAEHGLNEYALRQLLVAMRRVAINEVNNGFKWPKKFPSSADIETTDFVNIDVLPDTTTQDMCKEKTVQVGQKKRFSFDIALTAEFGLHSSVGRRNEPQRLLLIVENKVKSSEGHSGEQTKDYAEWVDKTPCFPISSQENKDNARKTRNLVPALLFLTPRGDKASSQDFVNMSYQDFVDMVLVPCLRNSKLTQRGRVLIEEYLEALSDADYCLTPRDITCVQELFNKHEKTLEDMTIASEYVENEEEDEDDKNRRRLPRVTFKDLVDADLLEIGDVFVCKNNRRVALKKDDGAVGFESEDGDTLLPNPSCAAKDLECSYPGWDAFERESTGRPLRYYREQYLEKEKLRAEKFKNDPGRYYADAVLSKRKKTFLLIERAIRHIDQDEEGFSLPAKYTRTSSSNFDYGILLDSKKVTVDSSGAVSAYFRGRKSIKAKINLSKKPYQIALSDNAVYSALDATKKVANEAGVATSHGTYQWSAYWFVEGTSKSFKDLYKEVAKKQGLL
jgi:hypothetical protein